MNAQPVELLQQIFSYLDPISLCHTRLTNKRNASIGELYLLSTPYTIKPTNASTTHLLSLSQHARLAPSLTSLLFHFADINEYHARHNTYFLTYMRDPEDREENTSAAWHEYRTWKALKETHAETFCQDRTLRAALLGLPNLHSVEISLNRCPLRDELWKRLWIIPSTRALQRVATTQRTRDVLLAAAAAAAPSRLRRFAHDRLPFEFWGQKEEILRRVAVGFEGLTRLKFTCDYSTFPNERHREECMAGLGGCLRAATGLQELDVAFTADTTGSEGKPVLELMRLMRRDGVGEDEQPGPFRFRQLHTFRLQGVTVSVTDLLEFLVLHETSLRSVTLGGMGLESPPQPPMEGLQFSNRSFEELCDGIRAQLLLDEFKCRPSLDADGSGRLALPGSPVNGIYHLIQGRQGVDGGLASGVEDYVLGRADWPVERPPDWPDHNTSN